MESNTLVFLSVLNSIIVRTILRISSNDDDDDDTGGGQMIPAYAPTGA